MRSLRLFEPIFFPFESENDLNKSLTWKEKEGYLESYFDLPGMNKNEIKVKVANNVITISGERKEKILNGFSSKKYFYQTYVPEKANGSDLEAEYLDGVLTLKLKQTEIKDNFIQIK